MATQTITVNTAAELNQALSSATGGETILLAAGNYGKLSLKGKQYASEVTIKSADANAMASFSEAYVKGSSNITFDTVMFDYTYSSGDRNHTNKFLVENSSNITFTDSVFDGDFSAGGTGFGKGLVIRGSTNVDVVDTEFHSFWKALGASKSSDLTMVGNNIHTIRSDGISLGEVQNVLIENNYIHDFGGAAGSGDHRDMIQIQRSNGTGSSDIIIRNNVLDMGAGDYTQGIWAGLDKGSPSDPTHWNYNFTVEGNILYNAHANGIALHVTDGLNISNNTLIAVPSQQTGGVATPKIIVSAWSKNVTVENNVTPSVVGHTGRADWTVQNNAIVGTGNYDSQFTYHATAQADGYNQYGVIPGSTVDILNAGSSLVDNYPFDYDSWVGSSSTTVGGTGTGGTGTGGTGTTGTGGTSTGGTGTGGTGTGGTGTGTGTTDTDDTDTGSTGGTGTGGTGTGGTGTGGTGTGGTGTGTGTTDTDDTDTGSTGGTGTGGTGGTGTGGTGTDTGDMGTGDTGTDGTDTGDTVNDGSGTGGTQPQMVFDDFVLDIAGLPGNGQAKLKGDATVVNTASGPAIQFDGDNDQAKLGRLRQFEDSEQIAFTVEFARDAADGSAQRLVWNKGHVGLSLQGDGLKAHVKNNDGKFHEGFQVKNLGLNDTNTHQITLMVDQVTDRLQVLVDGQLVLDETNTDFDFVGSNGGREWGWDLGLRNRDVDGFVSGFAIDDDVQFVNGSVGTTYDLFG